ncbi:MAG TPA: hypothetical protein VFQ61_17055 [Polyangiaceae bacterium]|nr:hypothetical protein [Polyangiaceae bacterium]
MARVRSSRRKHLATWLTGALLYAACAQISGLDDYRKVGTGGSTANGGDTGGQGASGEQGIPNLGGFSSGGDDTGLEAGRAGEVSGSGGAPTSSGGLSGHSGASVVEAGMAGEISSGGISQVGGAGGQVNLGGEAGSAGEGGTSGRGGSSTIDGAGRGGSSGGATPQTGGHSGQTGGGTGGMSTTGGHAGTGGSSGGAGGTLPNGGTGGGTSCSPRELLVDGGFEKGPKSGAWIDQNIYGQPTILQDPLCRTGSFLAWFGETQSDDSTLHQDIMLPRGTQRVTVSCWYQTAKGIGEAQLQVSFRIGTMESVVAELKNARSSDYAQIQKEFLNPSPGQPVAAALWFHSTSSAEGAAPFRIDDCSVMANVCGP